MAKFKVSKDVIGHKIVAARRMTEAEGENEGWLPFDMHGAPQVLILDNGILLYPSRDSEGNGAGALFGLDADSIPISMSY